MLKQTITLFVRHYTHSTVNLQSLFNSFLKTDLKTGFNFYHHCGIYLVHILQKAVNKENQLVITSNNVSNEQDQVLYVLNLYWDIPSLYVQHLF